MKPHRAARRAAGLLALALLLLGAVVAPALDAWAHARDSAAAGHEQASQECVLCTVAHTTLQTTPTPITIAVAEWYPVPRTTAAAEQPRSAPERLTPPTRGPPAA